MHHFLDLADLAGIIGVYPYKDLKVSDSQAHARLAQKGEH